MHYLSSKAMLLKLTTVRILLAAPSKAETAIRSVMDLDDILDLLLCTDVETSCNNIMSLKEDLMVGMVDQEDWYVDLTV